MFLRLTMCSGVHHEGTPTGKIETIGGVRNYVATPSVEHPEDKVLLFLTDVFGLDLINAQARFLPSPIVGEKLKSTWAAPGGRLRGERIQGGQRADTRVWLLLSRLRVCRRSFPTICTAMRSQSTLWVPA
jgi:hypothetical protein